MAENQHSLDMTRHACDAFKMSDTDLGMALSVMTSASKKHVLATYESDENSSQMDALRPMLENIMPEVSARLFARDGITMRRPRASSMEHLSGAELRAVFIDTLQSEAFRRYTNILFEERLLRKDLLQSDLITSPVVNGNIVAIALDRLAPPSVEHPDRLAKIVKTTGSILGLDCEDGMWRPEFTAHHEDNSFGMLVSDQLCGMFDGDDDLDFMDDFDSDEGCHEEAPRELVGRKFEMETCA